MTKQRKEAEKDISLSPATIPCCAEKAIQWVFANTDRLIRCQAVHPVSALGSGGMVWHLLLSKPVFSPCFFGSIAARACRKYHNAIAIDKSTVLDMCVYGPCKNLCFNIPAD